MNAMVKLDALDRQIINTLQGGFPICDEPYGEVASWLGVPSRHLIERLDTLLANGAISRFGPLFNSECMGGAVTLAALEVPEDRFEEVAALVNAHREVAHNYAREHLLNMWFVVSCETPGEIEQVLAAIASETGLKVYNCPKEREYFIGLRLEL